MRKENKQKTSEILQKSKTNVIIKTKKSNQSFRKYLQFKKE